MVVFRNIGIFVEMCILVISLRKNMEKMEKRSRKLIMKTKRKEGQGQQEVHLNGTGGPGAPWGDVVVS